MDRFIVEVGVCWTHGEWEVYGPYEIYAASEMEAEAKAVGLSERDIEDNTDHRKEVAHIFTLNISVEESLNDD